MSRVHLLIVDAQNDFCDLPEAWRPLDPATGDAMVPALPVPGAHADMQRLAGLIRAVGPAIDAITATLDTHHRFDIAHTVFWRRREGGALHEVAPFTEITLAAARAGEFVTADPANQPRALAYLERLASRGRYTLRAWPVHVQEGEWGHALHAGIRRACEAWELAVRRNVEKVVKGQNTWTEHYSAIEAEVPDAADERTLRNDALLRSLDAADEIWIGGIAGSHCVKATALDVAAGLPSGRPERIVLLTDCMSPVAGCEADQQAFLEAMRRQGARLATSAELISERRVAAAA